MLRWSLALVHGVNRVVELSVFEHHGREVWWELGHPEAVLLVATAWEYNLEEIDDPEATVENSHRQEIGISSLQ